MHESSAESISYAEREPAQHESVVRPNSIIKLYPTLIRQDNSKDFSIIRLGCPTVTVVSTTAEGAEACRLLGCGLSIDQTASRLSAKFSARFASGAADLTKLVGALRQARMVRSIDGREFEAAPPSAFKQFVQRAEWARIRLRSRLSRALIHYAPVEWSYPVLYAFRLKWNRGKRKQVRMDAHRNLDSVFGSSVPGTTIGRFARDFVAEQVRRDIDLEYLSVLPEVEVGKWLRRRTSFEGLDRLDAALEEGRGVMLNSFHFSSAHLLTLMLWLKGYSFIGAGGITRSNRDRPLPFDNPELARALGGCGNVTWFTTFTVQHGLQVCRRLNKGGLALVFPDGFFARPKGDVAEYFGNTGSQYRRAYTKTPFLGRVAEANTGVPWIYQQCAAPLLPVKLVRESNCRFRVLIGKRLEIDRTASLSRITEDLYRVLEREIALDPPAWAYWRKVHEFTAPS